MRMDADLKHFNCVTGGSVPVPNRVDVGVGQTVGEQITLPRPNNMNLPPAGTAALPPPPPGFGDGSVHPHHQSQMPVQENISVRKKKKSKSSRDKNRERHRSGRSKDRKGVNFGEPLAASTRPEQIRSVATALPPKPKEVNLFKLMAQKNNNLPKPQIAPTNLTHSTPHPSRPVPFNPITGSTSKKPNSPLEFLSPVAKKTVQQQKEKPDSKSTEETKSKENENIFRKSPEKVVEVVPSDSSDEDEMQVKPSRPTRKRQKVDEFAKPIHLKVVEPISDEGQEKLKEKSKKMGLVF